MRIEEEVDVDVEVESNSAEAQAGEMELRGSSKGEERGRRRYDGKERCGPTSPSGRQVL